MAISEAFLVLAALEPQGGVVAPHNSADVWTSLLTLFGTGGLTGILIAFFTFWTERTKAARRKGIPEIEGDIAPLAAPTVHLQGPIIQATQELRGLIDQLGQMMRAENAILEHLRVERIDVAEFREFLIEHIRHAKHEAINAVHEASLLSQQSDQGKQTLIRALHEKNEEELRAIKELLTRIDERTRPKR